MSRRTAESTKAILAAWNKEQELVKEGKGTREWSLQQQQDIIDKGKAYDEDGVAFQGQHMKSAERYPEYQGDPGNIQFLTRKEHLEAHDGNWRNPTNWYFNPYTKEKVEFGDGPFIPCKIIELSNPLVKNMLEPSASLCDAPESNVDTSLTSQQTNKVISNQKENLHKSNGPYANSPTANSKKTKHGIKNIAKRFLEFPAKHPKAMNAIKAAGVFGAIAVINQFMDNSESPQNKSLDSKYNPANSDINYKESDSSDEDVSSDDSSSTKQDKEYTPNDVPAGEQRYHYKDGSVRWKEKPPYHRGHNKDE